MASAIKGNRMYKYESIRIEWTIHFQNHHNRDYHLKVKNFFDNFHESHKGFQFAVGKIFDGTTHILVDPDDYRKIKEELERITGKEVPEVSTVSDVSIINDKVMFDHGTSYRKLFFSLKAENDEIKLRKKLEAENHLAELDKTLQTKPTGRLMAFDVEVYEHDQSVLLEIGFVLTTLTNPTEIHAFHYIIEENLHFQNKDFVPDNRERFKFGTSQRMSLKDAVKSFQQQVGDASILVTHSGSDDAKYLEKHGISLADKPMFDTQVLALALLPRGPYVRSLRHLLCDLHISFDEDILHNAANDAVYTMNVFLAITDKLDRKSENKQAACAEGETKRSSSAKKRRRKKGRGKS